MSYVTRHRRLQEDIASNGLEGYRSLAAALISIGHDTHDLLWNSLQSILGFKPAWGVDDILYARRSGEDELWWREADGRYLLTETVQG